MADMTNNLLHSVDFSKNEVATYYHNETVVLYEPSGLQAYTITSVNWETGKTELSDTSSPAASLFNPNAEGDYLMHHSITEITESSDGLISFIFDEEALGIKTTDNRQQTTDNVIYNLSGQRLSKPQKGINIINGKKYFE